jgi:hypothetical protein
LYAGAVKGAQLTIDPRLNEFYGSFRNPTTHTVCQFGGVLLPKSRGGGGLFVSQGLSGTVTIQY